MATEKRLIDANAFEEAHCFGCPYRLEGNCTKDDPICSTIDNLRDFPTVDAVEVVRCKDCKFWKTWNIGGGWCEAWEIMRRASGFCDCGERKDNE